MMHGLTSNSPTLDTNQRRVRVVRSEPLSGSTKLLELEVENVALTWRPGQYVELVSLENGKERVPYSIASACSPAAPGRFEVAVSGSGKHGLAQRARVGDRFGLLGPKGGFVRGSERRSSALFVAAGTGVAPLRAMIQAALAQGQEAPLALLFGCRSESDVLFRAEFERWKACGSLRFEPTLSRPSAGWMGRSGHVQVHVAELLDALREPEIFVCGSREMVDSTLSAVERLGVPGHRVFVEKY